MTVMLTSNSLATCRERERTNSQSPGELYSGDNLDERFVEVRL